MWGHLKNGGTYVPIDAPFLGIVCDISIKEPSPTISDSTRRGCTPKKNLNIQASYLDNPMIYKTIAPGNGYFSQ